MNHLMHLWACMEHHGHAIEQKAAGGVTSEIHHIPRNIEPMVSWAHKKHYLSVKMQKEKSSGYTKRVIGGES